MSFIMPPSAPSYIKTLTTALAGDGDFPFGGWRHHLPAPLARELDSQSPTALCESSSLATTSWWDYGYITMEPCLCRTA